MLKRILTSYSDYNHAIPNALKDDIIIACRKVQETNEAALKISIPWMEVI